MTFAQWMKEFKALYRVRFGMPPEDGGLDDSDFSRRHEVSPDDPYEAVSIEGEKYDLIDATAGREEAYQLAKQRGHL